MQTVRHPLLRLLFGLAVIAALFTGFGNMPLYGRYYIADVPGLAWSGDFFINVSVHILVGSLLLAIGLYLILTAMLTHDNKRFTLVGKIGGSLLALTLVTGILMVVKNLPGIHFPMPVLMVFNFSHMSAAMMFMLAALVSAVFRKPWRLAR